jgi:uncharacterized repeat protein (TIGR03803 family)
VKPQNLYATLVVSSVVLLLGSNAWAAPHEKVIHAFRTAPAAVPNSRLVADAAGNLYGTTESDDVHSAGTVYELSPVSGGGWSYRVLHVFNNTDGAEPIEGKLLLDAAGNLYGTTAIGGAHGSGTVFELISHSGGKRTFKTLHNFNVKDGGEKQRVWLWTRKASSTGELPPEDRRVLAWFTV